MKIKTSLSLDADILIRAKEIQKKTLAPVSATINEWARIGLLKSEKQKSQ
jgi:hypothetical protein